MTPRTLPVGFCRAVNLPKRIALAMFGGISTRANRSHHQEQKIGDTVKHWSHVIPDGPAAAPLRDERKTRANLSSSNSNGLAGT